MMSIVPVLLMTYLNRQLYISPSDVANSMSGFCASFSTLILFFFWYKNKLEKKEAGPQLTPSPSCWPVDSDISFCACGRFLSSPSVWSAKKSKKVKIHSLVCVCSLTFFFSIFLDVDYCIYHTNKSNDLSGLSHLPLRMRFLNEKGRALTAIFVRVPKQICRDLYFRVYRRPF